MDAIKPKLDFTLPVERATIASTSPLESLRSVSLSKSFPTLSQPRAMPWEDVAQFLFLASLLLYPFSIASHTLYLVPQGLLLAIVVYQLAANYAVARHARAKFELVFLALATLAPAIVGELAAATPEYSEVGKLALNIATIVVLLFSTPIFSVLQMARWLPRFTLVWFSFAIIAYVLSGTTFLDLAVLFNTGSPVSSSGLYGLAEPLNRIFLTKNIAAMYVVAVYGLFLYSSKTALQKIKLWQHGIFLMSVLAFASRQGVLSMVVMIGIARITSDLSVKRRITEITLAASIGFIVFFGLFDLSSPDDGAFTRLGLWRHFLQHADNFVLTGDGLHGLNQSLLSLEIDNYHMFFMNQIGAYGILHCLAFNAFLFILIFKASPSKCVPLLIGPYWLNVCFQTYGYEYGNLFLLIVAANTFRQNAANTFRQNKEQRSQIAPPPKS